MEIGGSSAIVTGAGSGIGRRIALRLARAGAAVVVDDIDDSAGEDTVRLIEAEGGRAAFLHADVAVEADIRRLVAFAESRFGGPDILVNNAGVRLGDMAFPNAATEAWTRVLQVYLYAVMLAIQHALPAMRRRGRGAVVNISSGAGVGFAPHDAPEYAAAKAAVLRLTAALAPLRESDNVRVNCICPGWVRTEWSEQTIAAMSEEERRSALPPSMRWPEEVADAVVWFLRNDAVAGRVMLLYETGPRELLPVAAPF
jgi:NAD(P)-dependent dehydrogenase (short-subunit alcohol dehydrogenase family)